jgi:hypothetical protein
MQALVRNISWAAVSFRVTREANRITHKQIACHEEWEDKESDAGEAALPPSVI